MFERRAPARMRADEAQYRLLFEASPLPTWIAEETSGRFLVVNEAAVRRYGYSREELSALTVDAVRLPYEDGHDGQAYRTQANAPFVLAGACRHRRKDGSVFDAEIRAARVNFDGVAALLTVVFDANREKAADALRASEIRFEDAQALAQVGSWSWDALTGDSRWSRELQRIYGVPAAATASLVSFLSLVHPEDRTRVSQRLEDARTHREKRFDYECRLQTPSGETRMLKVRHVAAYDPTGQPLAVTGSVLDITEQRRAETELADRERLYRELAEHATDLAMAVASDGLFLHASPSMSRTLGYAPERLLGHPFLALVDQQDARAVEEAMARAFAAPGIPFAITFRFLHQGGAWHSLEATVQASVEPGMSGRLIVNARDMTQWRTPAS